MKYLYTATRLSHIVQFHQPYMQMLKEQGHTVHVAAKNNLKEKNGLHLKYCDSNIDIPFERSPFDINNIKAYQELKALFDSEHYDIIICNTPVGGFLTRLAARTNRKQGTKVIYIAHGFHFYNGASILNWLLFYPLEKEMAHLCDIVVTINEEDYMCAMRHFPGRIAHIHGIGVSTDRYHPVAPENQTEMRRGEGLLDSDFVVLCTGELNENKNQKTLISAAARLRERIPNLKVLLAGNGPTEQALKEQIASDNLQNIVKLIGYRTDLERVVPAVDVVVSCSKREGLPLNIIEAMLCKKPVVASINRGHLELVENGKTGYLVESDNVMSYVNKLEQLFCDPLLRTSFGEKGYKKAQSYSVEAVMGELKQLLIPSEIY